jgi:hypothetical protein
MTDSNRQTTPFSEYGFNIDEIFATRLNNASFEVIAILTELKEAALKEAHDSVTVLNFKASSYFVAELVRNAIRDRNKSGNWDILLETISHDEGIYQIVFRPTEPAE